MGQNRSIIKDEFDDEAEIDTHKNKKHKSQNFIRKRKRMKEKGDKVRIWVKNDTLTYEKELTLLQTELLKFQNYVKEKGLKVLMLFEGRDTSGKSGTIRRITEHLNPRGARVVALEKPSDRERTQWYFQRYTQYLPSAGEMVFFDRSWYNRASVEPVMGFCTHDEHYSFLRDVSKFEEMLIESNIILIKFYFSFSKEEQLKRIQKIENDPLKQYKLSPIDKQAQTLWDQYTIAKFSMLVASNTKTAPWVIVKSDNKKRARINCIKHILNVVNYPDQLPLKDKATDPKVIIPASKVIDKMEHEKRLNRKLF